MWNRSCVHAVLTNPAYTGRTFVFTTGRRRKQFTRPQADWVDVPGATPAIISQELFDAAQKQLQVNRTRTMPQTKHEYLLRGQVRCRQCGRAYVGSISTRNGERHVHRFYRCTGKLKMSALLERCHNKGWNAEKLESMVWSELERYLSDRDLMVRELERQRQDAGQAGVYEAELGRVERQLKVAESEQHRLLQWALKGFPESQVEAENRRLNKAKETLKAQKTELEAQVKASRNAAVNMPHLESFIKDMQDKLPTLDYDGKRLALEMLGVTVWLDGENVEVTGAIEPELYVSRCPTDQGRSCYPKGGFALDSGFPPTREWEKRRGNRKGVNSPAEAENDRRQAIRRVLYCFPMQSCSCAADWASVIPSTTRLPAARSTFLNENTALRHVQDIAQELN